MHRTCTLNVWPKISQIKCMNSYLLQFGEFDEFRRRSRWRKAKLPIVSNPAALTPAERAKRYLVQLL